MIAEVQRIADSLGRSLGRPIGVDDPKIRLLAYNSVDESQNDDARRFAILNRQASMGIRDWVASHRPLEAAGLFLVRENPELGLTSPRWGAVARSEEIPVAFVWVLVSPGEQLTEGEQSQVLAAAAAVGEAIGRQHLVDELRSLREREGLGDLFGSDSRAKDSAAERLIEAGLFPGDATCTTLVLLVESSGAERSATRVQLEETIERFRLLLPTGYMLATLRPGHAAVVVARAGAESTRFRTSSDLARGLQRVFAEVVGADAEAWIGIGRRADTLVCVDRSYREALQSAEVASSIQGLGSPIHFNRLGVYRRLAQLDGSDQDRDRLHPGIQALLDRELVGDHLATTLEVYLDNAGDAAKSAAELHLHRASLYGRLRRIEEIATLDLRNGQDRLVAHLELKLARLHSPQRHLSA